MDRLVKRTEGVAADHARIAMSLTSLTESSADTYATDTNEVPLLNDGLAAMSKHLSTYQTLLEDEGRGWDEGVLEDLKRQRDSLVSVRELFDRRDKLDRDTIPYLERRIQTNETRLTNLRAKPEGLVKPGEIEKVAEAIIKVRTRASAAAAGSSVSSLFSCQLLVPLPFRTAPPSGFIFFLFPVRCTRYRFFRGHSTALPAPVVTLPFVPDMPLLITYSFFSLSRAVCAVLLNSAQYAPYLLLPCSFFFFFFSLFSMFFLPSHVRQKLTKRRNTQDKESIVQQHNRSIFVKECLRDELQTFQSTQYHVSRWNQDWAGERVKYAEMLADNWRRLLDELEGMPLGD